MSHPSEGIGFLLHQCAKLKAYTRGLTLHAVAYKSGIHSDVIVSNHVLNMYAKCGKMFHARKVFDEMPQRNLVSWSAMISGYDQVAEHSLALDLYSQMCLRPNEYIFASAVSACAGLTALVAGQQLHGQSLKLGCASISFVANALISMYMKCGQCSDALLVHSGVLDPTLVSYNALISGFADSGQSQKGFETFKLMQQHGLVADEFTLAGMLKICSDSADQWKGPLLHCHSVKLKLDSTAFIGNAIIKVYSNLKLVEEAEKVFWKIEDKDLISWNTILTACSHCDDHVRALNVFRVMLTEHNLHPDDFTFSGALAACAGLASLQHGKQIHSHLIRTKLHTDVGVNNSLVNMYAKCGSIGNSYNVFKSMDTRNLVSWNTIIAGYGIHGLGAKALELFQDMKTEGIRPDSVTFLTVLTACNHSGLVDEGQLCLDSMVDTYGIVPDTEHLSSLIDLLGRAGSLQKAEEYIDRFQFGNDPIVLGSLLSGCVSHGDVSMGERLGKRLLKLQPVTTSPYVLLSNLYASGEIWQGVAEAKRMLKVSGLKKEPGFSLIELDGAFEKFSKGDLSHSRIRDIKNTLTTLSSAEEHQFCYLR
ncbi:Putative pentatricopeptide repeat-containing protein At3g15130 [Linum grandiflorum]